MMGRVIVLDEGDRLSFAGSLPDALEHAISSMGTVYEEVTGISHQTELEQRKAIIAARDKEIADLQAIANRPLDGDMNTLIDRCEKKNPLSLADQRELWAWLEERGATIGDLQAEVERLKITIDDCHKHIDFEASSKNAITTRCFALKEQHEAIVAARDKEITELRALVEIIKEADARFGHFRKLRGLDKSGPGEALAEVADIIHRVAEAAKEKSNG